jgi:hypothetical protein
MKAAIWGSTGRLAVPSRAPNVKSTLDVSPAHTVISRAVAVVGAQHAVPGADAWLLVRRPPHPSRRLRLCSSPKRASFRAESRASFFARCERGAGRSRGISLRCNPANTPAHVAHPFRGEAFRPRPAKFAARELAFVFSLVGARYIVPGADTWLLVPIHLARAGASRWKRGPSCPRKAPPFKLALAMVVETEPPPTRSPRAKREIHAGRLSASRRPVKAPLPSS